MIMKMNTTRLEGLAVMLGTGNMSSAAGQSGVHGLVPTSSRCGDVIQCVSCL